VDSRANPDFYCFLISILSTSIPSLVTLKFLMLIVVPSDKDPNKPVIVTNSVGCIYFEFFSDYEPLFLLFFVLEKGERREMPR